jgi:hypothetical protein
VYRLIDDSLQAEKTGLQGTACIDARWKKSAEKNLGSSHKQVHKNSLTKRKA